MRTSKKGQEEIVGFVLIMVIVAVIFIILLALFVRQQGSAVERTSEDVYSFLSSMNKFTSDCVIRQGSGNVNLGELLSECYSDSVCGSGRKACDVLNESIVNILNSGWNVGKENSAKGYIFNATYKSESTKREIISIKKGDCSFNIEGADQSFSTGFGTISSVLKICF